MSRHRFPVIVPDHDSRPHWAAAEDDRLLIQVCAACARGVFPPLPGRCPFCRGQLAWQEVARTARVNSWIGIERAIHGWESTLVPFTVVLAQLDAVPDVKIACLHPGDASGVRLGDSGEIHFSHEYGEGPPRPVFKFRT